MSIELMDPYNWPDCPIPECGNGKAPGYLTCPYHRNECPDGDCRGNGWKTTYQQMCYDCFLFFSQKTKGKQWFWVYMLNNNYIGMTSNPQRRLQEHIKHRSRYIYGKRKYLKDNGAHAVYWSPPFYDWKQALRCEWGLDYMLDIAIEYGDTDYADIFLRITKIQASENAIAQAPGKPTPTI